MIDVLGFNEDCPTETDSFDRLAGTVSVEDGM